MSIDDPARQTELRMLRGAAVEGLPADYRAVIPLRDAAGHSYQEIAEALDLTVVNVKARLHRARLFLRKRLDADFWMAGVASLTGRRMSGGRSPRAVLALVLAGAQPAPARTGRETSACQAPHVAEQIAVEPRNKHTARSI